MARGRRGKRGGGQLRGQQQLQFRSAPRPARGPGAPPPLAAPGSPRQQDAGPAGHPGSPPPPQRLTQPGGSPALEPAAEPATQSAPPPPRDEQRQPGGTAAPPLHLLSEERAGAAAPQDDAGYDSMPSLVSDSGEATSAAESPRARSDPPGMCAAAPGVDDGEPAAGPPTQPGPAARGAEGSPSVPRQKSTSEDSKRSSNWATSTGSSAKFETRIGPDGKPEGAAVSMPIFPTRGRNPGQPPPTISSAGVNKCFQKAQRQLADKGRRGRKHPDVVDKSSGEEMRAKLIAGKRQKKKSLPGSKRRRAVIGIVASGPKGKKLSDATLKQLGHQTREYILSAKKKPSKGNAEQRDDGGGSTRKRRRFDTWVGVSQAPCDLEGRGDDALHPIIVDGDAM
eukprot:TRINITY_DN14134_c0_g1_i4.p1 TRINITY_DN14134_c0_g1~~TRINITY_DN14134_c0_g1_i4.p1  ORF type:complete len:417 (+),score=69.52 TRINITY_DN14134_c0_g1_i4:68-1252(+)